MGRHLPHPTIKAYMHSMPRPARLVALLLAALSVSVCRAFVPRPALVGRGRRLAAAAASAAAPGFHSLLVKADSPDDWEACLKDLCAQARQIKRRRAAGGDGLGFLFCSASLARHFSTIAATVAKNVDCGTTVAVVAGGVCGGAAEETEHPATSLGLLFGSLPPGASARPFTIAQGSAPPVTSARWKKLTEEDPTGFLLFADPASPVQEVIAGLDNAYPATVTVGGLSVASEQISGGPALALNGDVLDPRTVLGIALSGNVALHSIVAQGCRPVGPTFTITEAQHNIIKTLDKAPAVEALQSLLNTTDESTRALMKESLFGT